MKDIPGYEGRYGITTDGEIWSYPKTWHGRTHAGKWLVPFVNKNTRGYKVVCLSLITEGNRTVRVHRLVAKTYLKNPLKLIEVNHKNGIKTDNRAENLEWCTHRDNVRHAVSLGLIKRKLSQEQVARIKGLASSGMNKLEIAALFGIKVRHVYKILNSEFCRVYKKREIIKLLDGGENHRC